LEEGLYFRDTPVREWPGLAFQKLLKTKKYALVIGFLGTLFACQWVHMVMISEVQPPTIHQEKYKLVVEPTKGTVFSQCFKDTNGIYSLHGEWEQMDSRRSAYYMGEGSNICRAFKPYSSIENSFGYHHNCCANTKRKVETQKWWKFPASCEIPGEPIEILLQTIKNTNLSFVGDSLTRQTTDAFFTSLEEVGVQFSYLGPRYFENGVKRVKNCQYKWDKWINLCTDNTNQNYACDTCSSLFTWYIPNYNITVNYLWFYYMEAPNLPYPMPSTGELNEYKMPNTFNRVESSLLESLLEETTHMVINFGLHHATDLPRYFNSLLDYVFSILSSDIDKNPTNSHVYRLTFPQHFPLGDYSFGKQMVEDTRRHWTDAMSHQKFSHFPRVKGLDYFALFKKAASFHSKDGSHVCYSTEFWKPFWLALAAIWSEKQ